MKKLLFVKRVDYSEILERDGRWCYICEQDILPHHTIHFDHVVPLARGGAHADFNIKPTHDVCNMRKNAKLLEEMTPYYRRGVS